VRIFNVYGKAKAVLAALAVSGLSVLLASCGGGGVSGSTGLNQGDLAILPGNGTMYANVPFNFTIAGGSRPYTVFSNEQTLLPLNFTVNGNSFTVVPNNPGVVDLGQDPNAVPSRTVIITVRDNAGTQITASYNVLQNFMTGYSFGIQSISTCSGTDAVAACAGAESLISIRPTSAGLRQANRQIRFTVNYGPFAYIQADNTTLANTFTMTTDSTGNGTARFIPAANAFTQLASLRATDVQTGAYLDTVFTILSAPTVAMEAIPTALPTLTGGNAASCGFGSGSVLITGGRPPYTVSATSPFILFAPSVVNASGGSVSVTYGGGAPPNCASGQLVFTDAGGQILTVNAPSAAGTGVPVQPLAVAPTAVCISDVTTTRTVIVTGGNANKVVTTSNPALAAISGGTLTASPQTLTISDPLPAAVTAPGTATVTISDGATSVTVAVTHAGAVACP